MFKYKTLFHLSLFDFNGKYHDIGSVKIGFKGQAPESGDTCENLSE